jgi:hypothetical protein
MRNHRSTSRGLCLPATFRLQGLATLLAAYSLRSRAGFVSHRQRSWDSPFGAFSFRKVSGPFPSGRTHLLFPLSVYPRRRHGPARQVAVPGFQPFRESLAATRGVSARAAGCSLGFHPSRASTNAWARFSPRLLSRASATRTVHPDDGAPEYRSASAPPHPPPQTSRRYRLEHPHGVSAPA